MTGRRTFLKTVVGAFVASAVELQLAASPLIEKLATPKPIYILVDYMGGKKWISASMEKEWTARFGDGSGYAD